MAVSSCYLCKVAKLPVDDIMVVIRWLLSGGIFGEVECRVFEAVLFDFDGTLADTLPLSITAFETVFSKYDNREVTHEDVVAMFGPTEDDIIARNFKNRDLVPKAIEEYYALYRQGHYGAIRHDPAINELLKQLKAREKKIGVVTGKSRVSFQISSEALRLSEYFDLTITGDDVEKPKPDPEGILKALHRLGVEKRFAVFLGDSNADIRAGKAAGIRTFGVQWLSMSQSPVFDVAPDRIFRNISELLELIQNEDANTAD